MLARLFPVLLACFIASIALAQSGPPAVAASDKPAPSIAKPKPLKVQGNWCLRKGEVTDKKTRMVFAKDGTFAYLGQGAVSKGRYKVDGLNIQLVWTEIDGSKVKPGTVKKTLTAFDDGSGFMIGPFRYVRA